MGRAARAGRIGTAYSFITPDEMPFVLDLHLYLSKGIRPAPLEDDVVANEQKVLTEVDNAIDRGETVYGRFPQSVLDYGMDRYSASVDVTSFLTSSTFWTWNHIMLTVSSL